MAYRITNQSIPDITPTKVQLNTKSYDTQGEFDSTTNYRFTVTVAGYYWLYGQVYWGGGASNIISSMIFLNGSEISHIDLQQGSQYNANSVGTLFYLTVGDYVELYCYHNSGGSRSIYGGSSAFTFLCVHKIS